MGNIKFVCLNLHLPFRTIPKTESKMPITQFTESNKFCKENFKQMATHHEYSSHVVVIQLFSDEIFSDFKFLIWVYKDWKLIPYF